MDPISYPTITIGGETFEVNYRQCDIIALAKLEGINIFDQPKERLLSLEGMERTYTLLRYGLRRHREFTAEEIANEFDLGQLAELDAVVADAIKKAVSQIVRTINSRTQPVSESAAA